MIQNGKPHCDWCKREMIIATHNEDNDELWPWRHANAHICNECFDAQYDEDWKQADPCRTMCETKPCKRGGDCWYTPESMRNLPYETYFADRLESTGVDACLGRGAATRTISK